MGVKRVVLARWELIFWAETRISPSLEALCKSLSSKQMTWRCGHICSHLDTAMAVIILPTKGPVQGGLPLNPAIESWCTCSLPCWLPSHAGYSGEKLTFSAFLASHFLSSYRANKLPGKSRAELLAGLYLPWVQGFGFDYRTEKDYSWRQLFV